MVKFKYTVRLIVLAAALIVTISLAGCQNKTDSDSPNEVSGTYKDLKEGDAAPDFEAVMSNRESVKLSDYQGKVMLLNFWATWCSPCVSEMPDIQKICDFYSDEVVVLAINYGEDAITVKSFIEKEGYTFHVCLDEKQEISEKYPTEGIPYTVIIDKNGIITAIHLGGGKGMYSIFEEDIKAALEN